jgi:nicotinamidase-related amidase
MRGTPGQRKIPETALRHPWTIEPDPIPEGELQRLVREHPGDILFLKHRFDVFTNPNVEPVVRALAPTRVVLYGVALDVCDRFAVEGLLARFPDLELSLVTDAVKAIDPAAGSALLNEWQARGVALITTTQAVESLA